MVWNKYLCINILHFSSVSYGSYTLGKSREICKQLAVTINIWLKNVRNCARSFTHLWPTKVFHLSFRSSTISPSIISRCPSSACQNKIVFLFILTINPAAFLEQNSTYCTSFWSTFLFTNTWHKSKKKNTETCIESEQFSLNAQL